jgi:hypothetical protein
MRLCPWWDVRRYRMYVCLTIQGSQSKTNIDNVTYCI